jgi:hypothetical protein
MGHNFIFAMPARVASAGSFSIPERFLQTHRTGPHVELWSGIEFEKRIDWVWVPPADGNLG